MMGRWVVAPKQSDSRQVIAKARLVAKGFVDTRSQGLVHSNSPTLAMDSIRLILATVSYEEEVWLMDVSKAYLNAPADPNFKYILTPPDYINDKLLQTCCHQVR